MHAVKVLDEIGSQVRTGEVTNLGDVLLNLERKAHEHYTDYDKQCALLAELQALGHAGRALFDEAGGGQRPRCS